MPKAYVGSERGSGEHLPSNATMAAHLSTITSQFFYELPLAECGTGQILHTPFICFIIVEKSRATLSPAGPRTIRA